MWCQLTNFIKINNHLMECENKQKHICNNTIINPVDLLNNNLNKTF